VKVAYRVTQERGRLVVELEGGITARHAGELAKTVAATFSSGAAVTVRAREVEDIDTCVLQLLLSLRKTAPSFQVEDPSDAFRNAVERCALGRELLAGAKEELL
jgi:anti-anti-sigma regulatory factor